MTKKNIVSHVIALVLGLLGGLLGRDLTRAQAPLEKAVEAVTVTVDAGAPTVVNVPPVDAGK